MMNIMVTLWNPVKELKVFSSDLHTLESIRVESGEGIERLSHRIDFASSPERWNPVKELKEELLPRLRIKDRGQWNPVKELKDL